MTSSGRRVALLPFATGNRTWRRSPLSALGVGATAVASLVGVLGLLGWAFDVPDLRQPLPGSTAVAFNTALALVLVGLMWLVPRRAELALAGMVVVLALTTLVEHAFGVSLGIDQLLVNGSSGVAHPGRMAAGSAISLIVITGSRLLLDAGRPLAAQLTAGLVAAIQFVTLLGYAYDAPFLSDLKPLPTRAAPAAIALVLLSFAVLAAVPGGALRWVVDSDEPGALLTRRLLPVGLLGLPSVGGVVVVGERHGLYAGASTAALVVVACVLVLAAVAWTAARSLTAIDRRRILAIDELTDLKLDLQRQVVERATQLQRRRDEISILEDRQRIAADLHDGVIQRLFAAGMFLQGSAAGTTDPDARGRLDAAVETMDGAIKDLRTSIHELGRPGMVSDFSNAVDAVCTEAARALGFLPEVTVDDPENRAEDVRTDVLEVLREALSNVAEHAAASRVDVVLRSRSGFLWLTVTDDGNGMGRAAGGRGTRDMVKRARDHGGDCTWVAVQPHGTRVQWYVPAVFPGSRPAVVP